MQRWNSSLKLFSGSLVLSTAFKVHYYPVTAYFWNSISFHSPTHTFCSNNSYLQSLEVSLLLHTTVLLNILISLIFILPSSTYWILRVKCLTFTAAIPDPSKFDPLHCEMANIPWALYMPCILIIHLVLTTTFWFCYYYAHFLNEETKARSSNVPKDTQL